MFTKYHERGLAVIPIQPRSKAPVSDAAGFDEWAVNGQPTELIERFEEKFPMDRGFGIAVLCGPASNIAVVDIDTMDPAVISASPLSPVIRRGRDGRLGAVFMRYNPEIGNTSFKRVVDGKEIRVDILCHRKYIVVPPSIHETGIKYLWVTPDTLENFDVNDLPMLMPEHLERLAEAVGVSFDGEQSTPVDTKGFYDSPDGIRCAHGSHDRLKAIAGALISRHTPVHEAVMELISYDQDHHLRVPFFRDPRRGSDFGADSYSNALRFYASIMKTLNSGRVRRGLPVEIPHEAAAPQLKVELTPEKSVPKFVPIELPRPKGLLGEIMDLTFALSKRRQPAIALATAVSVASAVLSNRLRIGTIWANSYSLVIAGTGSGKGFAQDVVKRLLAIETDSGLMGQGTPMSGQAFSQGLLSQRERLDIMDECSDLFNLINNGGAFQQNIIDIMNTIWADSNSLYLGPSTKGSDPLRVFHPCVSALMLTNESGFTTTATKLFISKGFLPRCFMFVDWEYGETNKAMRWDPALSTKVVASLKKILAQKILMDPANSNLMTPKPLCQEITVSARAAQMIASYDATSDEEMKAPGTSDNRREILTRAPQLMQKLALYHGALNRGLIDEEDVAWAIATNDAMMHNASPLLDSISARTPIEAAILGILHIVRRSGSISIPALYEATRHLTKSVRNEAIESLKIEGKIALATDKVGNHYIAI